MSLPDVRSELMDATTRVFTDEDRTYIRRTPLPAHVVAIDYGVEPDLIRAVRDGADPRWVTCARCGGCGGRFDATYIESGCLACDGIGGHMELEPADHPALARRIAAWLRRLTR